MSIYVTGDIHGDPYDRLGYCMMEASKDMTKDDVLIICGDFGCVWNRDGESMLERDTLDFIDEQNFTTVFVDGNHENHVRLAEYPVKEWNGGLVHEIRPSVLHLMRGEIFDIQGKSFFAFGGARSHDIQHGIIDGSNPNWREIALKKQMNGEFYFRVDGVSWWKEELPTEEEMQHGLANLEAHGNKVDYIITHSPSTSQLALMLRRPAEADVLTKYLDDVRARTEFKRHYFGHMHENYAFNGGMDVCLYETIERIV